MLYGGYMFSIDQVIGGCLVLFLTSLAVFTATAGCYYTASKESIAKHGPLMNWVLAISMGAGIISACTITYLVHS